MELESLVGQHVWLRSNGGYLEISFYGKLSQEKGFNYERFTVEHPQGNGRITFKAGEVVKIEERWGHHEITLL